MTLLEALQKTLTKRAAMGPVERLRISLLTYAHDDPQISPMRVVQRVMGSDLRALFPGELALPPSADGANTGDLAVILDATKPSAAALERAALACGVSLPELHLLRTYIEHPLPHRRVIGYCAAVCLCALRQAEM